MQILVVVATDFELNAVKKYLTNLANVDFAVTGVGMLPTAYALTRLLAQKKYEWVFNVGIAGTFSAEILLGEAVVIACETVAESGIENTEGTVESFPKNLQIDADLRCPYINDFSFLQNVKKVNGLTVNLLTENAERVVQRKLLADVETMEGAAFFYVCVKENVKFLQLRGISNRVGERDKAQWKTQEALENVANLLAYCHSALDAESPD
ncbi:MAG: hypothetical protein LBU92_03865 [Prevotellaceae bacterium]|jgi:futalosine hydrolase|nr:hypothetical protein [Prevotellaceae bacterium]